MRTGCSFCCKQLYSCFRIARYLDVFFPLVSNIILEELSRLPIHLLLVSYMLVNMPKFFASYIFQT